MSRINSSRVNQSYHTYRWDTWMSHITRIDESYHTYECVVLHPNESLTCRRSFFFLQKSRHEVWVVLRVYISHMNEAGYAYDLRHFPMNKSCHTCEWAYDLRHFPMNKLCHTREWICVTHMRMNHVYVYIYTCIYIYIYTWASWRREEHVVPPKTRGGGLGSRPKKMYGERLGDGVEYHLMKPTPRR